MPGTLHLSGFERYDLHSELAIDGLWDWHSELRSAFSDLPPDRYGAGLNRYRRYSAAIFLPWQPALHWLPKSYDHRHGESMLRYYQGEHNPEHPGSVRCFPALPAAVEHNALLEAIIMFDFAQTFWSTDRQAGPFYIGVHFIKLCVEKPGQVAMTSPNCLHQDGEPFHFAHLVERSNAVGGVNVVATADCVGMPLDQIPNKDVLGRFTLTESLQAYGICDERVSHHLDPITKGDGDGPGLRSAILVDITPMRKDM